MVRVVPRAVSGKCELPSARAIDAAFGHLSNSRSAGLPLLPMTTPNTSPYPGIELWNGLPVLREHEVVHPSPNVGVEFLGPLFPRNTDTSPLAAMEIRLPSHPASRRRNCLRLTVPLHDKRHQVRE